MKTQDLIEDKSVVSDPRSREKEGSYNIGLFIMYKCGIPRTEY